MQRDIMIKAAGRHHRTDLRLALAKGDGRCQQHALAIGLNALRESSPAFSENWPATITADAIRQGQIALIDSALFASSLEIYSPDLVDYARHTLRNDPFNWGNEVTLQLAAEMFAVNIILVQHSGDAEHPIYATVTPLQKPTGARIFLLHYFDAHFDALISSPLPPSPNISSIHAQLDASEASIAPATPMQLDFTNVPPSASSPPLPATAPPAGQTPGWSNRHALCSQATPGS